MNRAVFFDRDGTVIRDFGYMHDPSLIEPLEGAAETLRELAAAGWRLIVVSNQSGVGRGIISTADMRAIQDRFAEMMLEFGAPLTAAYFCVHAPAEKCGCRKPSPLLLFEAAEQNGIDLRRSWMIGDRESDILSGKSAGCSTIWLRNGIHAVSPELPDFIAENWREIARIITG